jgi:hypothetical protein
LYEDVTRSKRGIHFIAFVGCRYPCDCFYCALDNTADYVKLVVGYLCVIIGQVLFLVGLDESILPIGKLVGKSLIRLKKVFFIIFFGFLFGLPATVA